MILGIISVVIGYLLGSFLPTYFLGKALKGIDIREEGQKNPGTVNAYHVLGLWPAVVTAFYDTLKGVAAMGIAYLLKVPEVFIYLSGIFAVAGHVFPFYLKFRGGQGAGASVGLLLTYLVIVFKNGWLPWQDLLFLTGLVLALLVIFRKGSIIGMVTLPTLYFFILLNSRSIIMDVFFGTVVAYIVFVNVSNVYVYQLFRLKPETKAAIKHLRVLMRPGAVAFPIFYLFYSKEFVLTLLGSVTLFFILVDLLRLGSKKVNVFVFRWLSAFFREKERHTFSTATLFLTSSFLTILLFDKAIATLAIIFLTFGDIFAKFTGLEHGRWRIFGKTLDGTLAYFATCLVAGFIWSQFVPVSWILMVFGAAAAAITELLPVGVNDNFVIPLMSAAVMRVIQLFF